MGDESVFNTKVDDRSSSGSLGLRLRSIQIVHSNEAPGSSIHAYRGHVLNGVLVYVGITARESAQMSRSQYGADWRLGADNHDLWRVRCINSDSMTLSGASKAYFDSIKVNTELLEGCFAVRNGVAVYSARYYKDGIGDCDLIMCMLGDSTSCPSVLPKSVNSTCWKSQPANDRDGTLFFSSILFESDGSSRLGRSSGTR